MAFYCCDKHYDQKELGEKKVHVVYTSQSQSVIEGRQSRNSSTAGIWLQELKERSQGDAAYRLALYGLLSLLFSTSQDHLLMAALTSLLPHQLLTKKILYKPVYWPIRGRHFLIATPSAQITLDFVTLTTTTKNYQFSR